MSGKEEEENFENPTQYDDELSGLIQSSGTGSQFALKMQSEALGLGQSKESLDFENEIQKFKPLHKEFQKYCLLGIVERGLFGKTIDQEKVYDIQKSAIEKMLSEGYDAQELFNAYLFHSEWKK